MFVFSEESTASKMVEAIVGCSYLGIERCAEEYADFSYKNGKGKHGWALIFQQISGTLPEMGYRVIQRTAGSWPYAVMFDSYSGTAITLLREENYRSRQDEIQRGIVHYVHAGIPANADLNDEEPVYKQMSLFDSEMGEEIQEKNQKPYEELEKAIGEKILRYGILTFRMDPLQYIKDCNLNILNAEGALIEVVNYDYAIPMNWKDAVPEQDITRFAVSGDFEHGGQIDDMPDLKPRKELKRKDG